MLKITLFFPCKHCGGKGYTENYHDEHFTEGCTYCGGKGHHHGEDHIQGYRQGSGEISREFMKSDEPCEHCEGKGKVYWTKKINKTTWFGKEYVYSKTFSGTCECCAGTGKKLHTIKQYESTCQKCHGSKTVFSHYAPTKNPFIKLFHPDAQIIESKICPSCNGKPHKKWEEYTYTNNPKL